jgi:hypothetical protein
VCLLSLASETNLDPNLYNINITDIATKDLPSIIQNTLLYKKKVQMPYQLLCLNNQIVLM